MGDSRGSKTANIILSGLVIKQVRRSYVYKRNGIQIQLLVETTHLTEFEYHISLVHCQVFYIDVCCFITNFFYCATQICIARTCYGDVTGWLGVRHTPVLYQNG